MRYTVYNFKLGLATFCGGGGGGRYFRAGGGEGVATLGGRYFRDLPAATKKLTLISGGRYFRGIVTIGTLRYVIAP